MRLLGLVAVLSLSILAGSASASRPHFVIDLRGYDVELKLTETIPNSAADPKHTRRYSATVSRGKTCTLDVGQYLQGGELPQPQRTEIAAEAGAWEHDERVRAQPTKLEDAPHSQAGPTTRFTALTPGKSTLVYELDDRDNAGRKNLSSPTHVVWRFEVELTVE